MKATQSNFAGQAEKLARDCSIFFFCGPDEAGASAAAKKIAELLPDAGERVDLAGAELRRDPALLGDEARSSSLFGDARHILVRAQGEEALEAIDTLIRTGDAGAGEACPVIVVATGATDKSRTAKLVEKRKDAVVGMFYPPDLRSVGQSVRQLADAAGLRLNGDMAERIARAANLDIRLAGSEVEKLALYLDASPQSPRTAEPADLDAIGASTEEDGMASLVNAVLSGKANRIPHEIARMKQVGLNPVGVLLAVERRAALLARLAAELGPRGRVQDLDRGQKARLGIFFKEERDITEQAQRWAPVRLDRLVRRLAALHRALLTNSQSAELLLAQELAQIARFAARR